MATAVEQILGSKSLFGRLGLPDAIVELGVLKKSYRQLALAVHPDKCAHTQAKEAFQKLSEAFDALSTEAAQRQHLSEGSGSAQRKRKRERQADSDDRWWNTQTWEEFEKRFRHRDAAEAALQAEFESGVRAKHNMRKIRAQILAAEKSAEHCDRRAGLRESELWRPRGGEERDLDASAAVARLLELLTHLRTVHRYCLHCSCVFDSFEDLERNCPGFTEEEHDRAPGAGSESTIEKSDQIAVQQPDPLDAFMAGMQDQLNNDLKQSYLTTKKRLQPQQGWSFEQQAQQNKNEMKRLKRGR